MLGPWDRSGEGKTLAEFLVATVLAPGGRLAQELSTYDYLAGLDAATGMSLFTSFGLSGTPVVAEISAAERVATSRTGIV